MVSKKQRSEKGKGQVRQAVLLAGGLGTRLRPFTNDNPKPMYPVAGRPFVEHLMLQIASFGIEEVVLLLGYMPQKIEDCLGDGSRFGLNLVYCETPVEYGTGARILNASEYLDEVFVLMYCDNYCPIDFTALVESFYRNNALVELSAYRNRDGYTKSNLVIAEDGRVLEYIKGVDRVDLNGVDIGYALVDKCVLDMVPSSSEASFEAAVYAPLSEEGRLYAQVNEHRYYSIGSYARLELTEQFFSHRKCAFVDRDGTLNVRPPQACYVETPEQFIWLEGAREALKLLKDAGWLVVIVSNQPGIARNAMSEKDLESINAKMVADLKAYGVVVDAIYQCLHDWDEGCFCRKPRPGMLFQAQKDFSLDLRDCVMFGDDERDMQAAQAAGCAGMLVDEEYTLLNAVREMLN